MICDRAATALTCHAYAFTGENVDELRRAIGPDAIREFYGRVALTSPDCSRWTFLDVGDVIVEGVGPGWDYYVIKGAKFSALWTPRAKTSG